MEMTTEQRAALTRKWNRDSQGVTLDAFIRSAQATIGCDGAVVVRWCGMWLAVERDGYTHS